jgi:hypothetical protein
VRDRERALRDLGIPLRIWVIGALIVVVAGLGVAALTWIAPRRETAVPEPVANPAEQEFAPAAAENQPAAAPAAEVAAPALPPVPPGATAGPDGVVRMEIPVVLPDLPEPEAGFQAELLAFAAGKQLALPAVDGLATLELIDVAGRVITYHYRVDINLRDYTLPTYQEPVIDLLDGWRCDGSVCFEFHHEAFSLDRCQSDIFPLIARGAVAVYEYRDINGLPMATRAVSAADCAAVLPDNPAR